MIRVAAGEKLALRKKDVTLTGWAVESRVYAEDPFRISCLDRAARKVSPAGRKQASTASRCATTPACRKAARSRSTTIR